MPEGDTIRRTAQTLNRALAGRRITRFETTLPALARVDFDHPLRGRSIEAVESAGKWCLMRFSGDLVLATHMRMHGSWHLYRPEERWHRPRHDFRVLIETRDFAAVAFNVPVAEFHNQRSLERHPQIAKLGPDLLAPQFDAAEALSRLRACSAPDIAAALLDQRVMAGVGNVFKSEILFACRVNPFVAVGSLPAADLERIVIKARRLLAANVRSPEQVKFAVRPAWRRTTGMMDPWRRLAVYNRAGKTCWNCGTAIQIARQDPGARVTYWCPNCQTAGLGHRLWCCMQFLKP